jgi:hypothetical protein
MAEIEYFACRSNIERYRLVVEQGFYDISRGLIHPSDEELSEIVGLYLCLKESDRINFIRPNKFPHEIVMKLLP